MIGGKIEGKRILCMLATLRIYFFQPRSTQCPGLGTLLNSRHVILSRGTQDYKTGARKLTQPIIFQFVWCDNRYSFRSFYHLLIYMYLYTVNSTHNCALSSIRTNLEDYFISMSHFYTFSHFFSPFL